MYDMNRYAFVLSERWGRLSSSAVVTAGLLFLACGIALAPGVAYAQKTIKVNFNSTAELQEADGKTVTATASTLTAAQKAAVIAQVQKEYDDAVGSGKVKVSEGSGGDYDITVSGGTKPNNAPGYGNAGKPGKSGIVYEGRFIARGLSGDDLVNGVAETVAHEAGHKLGLKHNWDSPPTKMTEGGKVTIDQRKADARVFTEADKKVLANSLALGNAEQKDTFVKGDLGVIVGQKTFAPPNEPDDDYLDVFAVFTGGAGAAFGYISNTGEFVFQGDTTDTALNPGFMTFLYTAGANLAVTFGGQIFSLEDGFGSIALSNLNPFNPQDFLTADVIFLTPFGAHELVLNATIDATTGGFVPGVPEPGPLLLLGPGLAGLVGIAWKRYRRRCGDDAVRRATPACMSRRGGCHSTLRV